MQTIILADDNGYYPLGTFPAHGANFLRAPVAIVSTDANGYDTNSVFCGAPIEMLQVTNIQGSYTDSNGSQVRSPIVAVQTDRKGYSLWSGAFIAAPIAVHLN